MARIYDNIDIKFTVLGKEGKSELNLNLESL